MHPQPQPQPSPRRGRSVSAAADSALKAPAPSLDPTPSPLRRITRSMASPLTSPVLVGDGLLGPDVGLTEGFTDKLLAEAGLGGAAAGGGGNGRGTRRSSINRFAEQQSRWGFVPGDEDTLNINMNVPGGWRCEA